MPTDYISDVFGAGGLFASRFPNYESREGQVALARMVDEAMSRGCHALGEGPCGTGKSLAYCVPSIWHAHHEKKRVVIATANIALQEQLVAKDLPMLAEVLPWSFSFALLKGRNNFLCSERHEESECFARLRTLPDEERRQISAIRDWGKHTGTGDVSELPFLPVPQVWSRFTVTSDECSRECCEFRDDCHYYRAKTIAHQADIIVTNFHMLFAHLAVRKATGRDSVLPYFDALVMDEAHEAADIAREFFGFTVSERSISRIASIALEQGFDRLGAKLGLKADRLFSRLAEHAHSPRYRRRLRDPKAVSDTALQGPLRALATAAAARSLDTRLERAERIEAERLSLRATSVSANLNEGLTQSDANKVYWLEDTSKGRVKLRAKPIHVGELLHRELFDQVPSVSLVSATLTAWASFEFARKELGVPSCAIELIADTPFDFENQALLVVPDGMPDPRAPEFVDAAARVFADVLDACGGRTLGLFTSYRMLNGVHERIEGSRHRVLRQGELPRAELTRIFKEDIDSVLLGTESFWTGIDVAGEALTAVVIDKLPFPHPDDPVIDAICERDPQAFGNHLVPLAIIALRQGVGRLIRCRSDVRVVVILDKRIAEKGYGRKFIKSLPPMLSTRRIENIARFLEESTYARAS